MEKSHQTYLAKKKLDKRIRQKLKFNKKENRK